MAGVKNAYVIEKFVRYFFFGVVIFAIITLLLYCQKHNWLESQAEKDSSVHHMVVEKMEQLGRLEVVKYRIKDVVEQKIERNWLQGGDTKVLVIVSGEAVGCIDLKKLKKENISVSEKTITVKLPSPQICYAKVNHNESKVYNAPTSPFSNNAGAVDAAFRNAENQIHQAAIEMGILQESRENAGQVLKPLLSAMTGKEVIILFEGDANNATLQKDNQLKLNQ